MNQQQPSDSSDDLEIPEVDFSKGVRGMHHEQYNRGTNLVLLEPDIARVFKDSESVNRALRLLLDLAKDQAGSNQAA